MFAAHTPYGGLEKQLFSIFSLSYWESGPDKGGTPANKLKPGSLRARGKQCEEEQSHAIIRLSSCSSDAGCNAGPHTWAPSSCYLPYPERPASIIAASLAKHEEIV